MVLCDLKGPQSSLRKVGNTVYYASGGVMMNDTDYLIILPTMPDFVGLIQAYQEYLICQDQICWYALVLG